MELRIPKYNSSCGDNLHNETEPDFSTLGVRLKQILAKYRTYSEDEIINTPDVFSSIDKLRDQQVLTGLSFDNLWDKSLLICGRSHINTFAKWKIVVYDYVIINPTENLKWYTKLPQLQKVTDKVDSVFDRITLKLPLV